MTPVVPFERYLVTLRLNERVRLHFNHGGVLMGLLSRALGEHPLPVGVLPFASESGRIAFGAGEPYQFGLTLAGEAVGLSDRLQGALARLGQRVFEGPGPPPALAGNFEVSALERVPPPDLDAEAAALGPAGSVTLRFLSPLRMERPADRRVLRQGFLNGDCFPPAHFLDRLYRWVFRLGRGRYPTAEDREMPGVSFPAADSEPVRPQLLWLDLPLESRKEGRPKGYTLGGVLGTVGLGPVPKEWLPWLVLGQYVHAGEHTHYGLGRYLITELHSAAKDPYAPPRSALERIADPAVLDGALAHVLEHSVAAGMDGVTPSRFAEDRDRLLEALAKDLREGRYHPSPLLGIAVPNKGGKLRPLTIPTVRDRVVQRATTEALAPALDTLLEDCSYAYRKGFSRSGAARAIERAYEQGYRYVMDADIQSFFDAVDWERMEAKLEALYPFEPLTGLAREWMRAPVVFDGRTIRRQRGLPQGTAISPLLANLYLDEFDEELLGQGYRLVRYADDFVVLCKDLETARRAKDDARHALGDLGLSLSPEKTAIHSLDHGFTYLGYLFCRSVVLESQAEKAEGQEPLAEAPVPAASWLAQVPLERVRELQARRTTSRASAQVEVVPLALPDRPSAPLRKALYVLTPETRLQVRGAALVVEAPEQEAHTIPMRELSHVVLCGRVRATVPMVVKLGELGVPVFFCRRSGELYGVYAGHPPDWRVWAAQGRAVEDERLRLVFAREVVEAKLHNFAALVVRFRLAGAETVASDIRELRASCENKTAVDGLRGLEGRAAVLYFGAMRETLDSPWGFAGRHKNPPPDPVNAMLSFGYTILYHHISTALLAAGLNPRIGLLHAEKGAYHALASDLQEEFRHLVDAHVWALIHRREVSVGDFSPSPDGRYPCLMQHDFRKRYVVKLEQRLLQEEFTPPLGARTTYRAFMDNQASAFRGMVLAGQPGYRALRVHG